MCQNSSKAVFFYNGCYSNFKSFIIAFVSHFQAKNFKGTFLIYQGAFHQGRNTGSGQLEYPPRNTLSASSGTPVRQHFKWKHALPWLHQKQVVSVTNVGFLSDSKWRQTEQENVSIQRTSAFFCSRMGTKLWLSKQNNVISRHFPLVLFQVSSDEYKKNCKKKKHCASDFRFQSANTFSLAVLKWMSCRPQPTSPQILHFA